MPTSTWLTTPPSAHLQREFTEARALTTGLSPVYLAYAQATQERQRQLVRDIASARLVPSAPSPAWSALPRPSARLLLRLAPWRGWRTRRLQIRSFSEDRRAAPPAN